MLGIGLCVRGYVHALRSPGRRGGLEAKRHEHVELSLVSLMAAKTVNVYPSDSGDRGHPCGGTCMELPLPSVFRFEFYPTHDTMQQTLQVLQSGGAGAAETEQAGAPRLGPHAGQVLVPERGQRGRGDACGWRHVREPAQGSLLDDGAQPAHSRTGSSATGPMLRPPDPSHCTSSDHPSRPYQSRVPRSPRECWVWMWTRCWTRFLAAGTTCWRPSRT